MTATTTLASGVTRCRVAELVGGTEETSCTTSEECAVGYTCVGATRCRQFCQDDADCDEDEHCIHPVQYDDLLVTGQHEHIVRERLLKCGERRQIMAECVALRLDGMDADIR